MSLISYVHRRLKGGLEGLEPPQYLERRGSAPPPPNFYCFLLTPQKESKLIFGVDETVKSFDIFSGHNDRKTA